MVKEGTCSRWSGMVTLQLQEQVSDFTNALPLAVESTLKKGLYIGNVP